jgi:hypothetical protein
MRALFRTVGTLARLWIGVVLAGVLGFSVVAGASDIVSYAIVQGDGSLRVQGKTIRLFGVCRGLIAAAGATFSLRCAATVRCAP